MSEKFPNSTFHGVDAYPVFPSEVKPQNCHFQLGNVADRLPYPDNYFDFIHQRLLIFGLTRSDWKNVRLLMELAFFSTFTYEHLGYQRTHSRFKTWWLFGNSRGI